MREPLWWSHPGPTAIECVGCGNLDSKHYDLNGENPLCVICWKELR